MFHSYVLDPLERAGSTFVQQLVVILLASGSAGAAGVQHWALAADTAGFAAALSLVMSVATFSVPKLAPGLDLALRVLKTFAQSFGGVLIASQATSFVHAGWKAALAAAIPTALLALLKGLAALPIVQTDGASLLPASQTAQLKKLLAVSQTVDINEGAQPPSDPGINPPIPAPTPVPSGGTVAVILTGAPTGETQTVTA